MFIDIHAHLNNEGLVENFEEVVESAKKFGVEKIVSASYDLSSCLANIELSKKPNVYATLGVHPEECFFYSEDVENLIKKEKNNPKIIAVGEIGIDHHDLDWQISEIISKDSSLAGITRADLKEKQREIFLKQLILAHEVKLPIQIHTRDSTNETLRILEENKNLLSDGGIIHCFNGSAETVKRILSLGLKISLGGSITFLNAKNIPETLKAIGLENIILETDCPYLCPEPMRGQKNEPKNIVYVAKKIASVFEISLEEVEKVTTENAKKVFKRIV